MAAAASAPLPPWALAAGAGAGALLAAGVAATWMFHRDALDEKRASRGTPETQAFVMATCGGDKFGNSVPTSGFLLTSLRFLLKDVRDTLTGARARVAAEGRAWPDAALAELPAGGDEGEDGGDGGEAAAAAAASAAAAAAGSGAIAAAAAARPPRLLRLHDLAPAARGRPLVLNFGSWT